MSGQAADAAPVRGTRPRNRRQLIIAAAADLFVRRGYPHTAMGDIADAVAIGPSALYRHFGGKRELLDAVVLDALSAVRSAVSDGDTYEQVLSALAAVVLDHRGIGVLWQRESRQLEPSAREGLRAELLAVHRRLARLVRRQRGELAPRAVDLLTWSALGAVMSIAFHRIELPRAEYLALLAGLADDVVSTVLPPIGRSARELTTQEKRLSTRDTVLAESIRMFAERGYHSVGIEDIGAAAGIAGPSVYHHFDSKADVLVAAMRDGARQLRAGMALVLAEHTAPPAALHGLLRSYVRYSLDNSAVVDVLITEVAHLPVADQHALRQLQHDYIAEWVQLLVRSVPGQEPAAARVRVQAALTITNDIARTPHLRALTGVDAALCAIGAAALGLS